MLGDGTWLMEWMEAAVIPAQDEQEYTDSVPFKLVHAPMDSDGTLCWEGRSLLWSFW